MENQPSLRHPLRRPGCVIALVLWFLILLTPCIMIMLATQGEISIPTGSAPEQRLRVWLVQEAAQSGIGISNVDVQWTTDEALCVQTSVRFLIWRGRAEEPSQYCECYEKAESDWRISRVDEGACPNP